MYTVVINYINILLITIKTRGQNTDQPKVNCCERNAIFHTSIHLYVAYNICTT